MCCGYAAARIYTAYIQWGIGMARAKVFQSGNSQAVRLPKEFRFAPKK